MSYGLIDISTISAVGDAIRSKAGTSATIAVSDLAQAIIDLPTGGGGTDDDFLTVHNATKYGVTVSGSYLAVDPIAFSCSSIIKTVSLPNCSYVGGYAFYKCSSLSSVTLPTTKYIGKNAFDGCSSTIKFSLCSDIVSIGDNCINGYSYCNFPKLKYLGTGIYNSNKLIGDVSLPVCSYIGNAAFLNCSSSHFTKAYIPECLYVGSSAFSNCFFLKNVTSPALQFVGNVAFNYCTAMEHIDQSNITYVGSSAFKSCYNLSYIDMPMCSTVGSSAFMYCYNVSYINMPTVNSVLERTFYSCGYSASVSGVAKFDNLTSIGSYAFTNAKRINYFYSPKLTNIGAGAFQSCNNLMSIYIGTSNCNLGINGFAYTPFVYSSYTGAYGSIYVPSDYADAYKTAANWSAYSSRIVGVELDSDGNPIFPS